MSPIRCVMVVCAAALVAGCASVPMGARPEIDDTDLPPTVAGERDRIVIEFHARDMDLTDASVQVEFSIDDGLTWSTATLVPGTSSPGVVSGNVVDDLPLADDWTDCRVAWDSYADDVGLAGDTPVRLRLTPSDLDGTGEPVYVPSPAGSINVNNRYAELDVDDSPIDFGLRLARAPETPAQDVTFTITNGTGALPTTLYWEVSADDGWLLVDGVDTTAAGAVTDWAPGAFPYQSTVTLSADVDGAALTANPTPYETTLTIVGKDTDAAGAPAHGTPVLVTVSVTVKDPEAELFLHDGGGSDPPLLAEFVCAEGDTTATPASQNFSVQNIGEEGSVLNWAALDDLTAPDWLPGFETGTDQGQLAWDAAAAAVTVSADPTGMPAGHYSATITVSGTEEYSGADAVASPGTVDVSLWVKTGAQVGLSTGSNQFSYGVDGAAYTADTFDLVLTNLGEQDLDWSVSLAGLPSWITGVTPSSGTGLAYLDTVTVQITVDPSAPPSLSAQVADYTYTLTFEADNSTTPSQTFEARVHVYNPPTINAAPLTMNFNGVASGPPPISQALAIWRSAGANVAPLNWTTPISYTSGAGWLSVTPSSGTTTGTSMATVTADPSAVPGNGTYEATISVTDPAAIGSPVLIPVTFVVDTSTVEILSFVLYADTSASGEYQNTLTAISTYFTDFNSTPTLTTDATTLAAELVGKNVFLIPEQESSSTGTLGVLGTAWSTVLTNFVNGGGTVIACSWWKEEHMILNNSGLMTLSEAGTSPSSAAVETVGSHLLTTGVTSPFTGSYVSTYSTVTNGTTVLRTQSGSYPVVIYRNVGAGHVVMIGTDFYTVGTGFDRIVANAVEW